MTVPITSDDASPQKPGAAHVVSRIAASLLGSYAFGWGFIALGIVLGVKLMPFGDAQTLVHLLTFLVLVTSFCWAFAARSLARVWLVLVGAGGVMTALAWLLSRSVT